MMGAVLNMEPNWHPVIVHFTIGLLLTAAVALVVVAIAPSGWPKRASLQSAGDWMLAIGILTALGAVAAGFYAYYTVAHDGPSHAAMTEHRNWAIGTTAAFVLVGLWRWLRRTQPPSFLFVLGLLAASGLLLSTVWHGGRLVYHHGLGVRSLPQSTGAGHDHDHGDGHDHSAEETPTPSGESEDDHDHVHADNRGHGPEPGTEAADGETPSVPAGNYAELDPKGVVAAFHGALERKDEAAVRTLLLPDVYIYESGNAERSLDQYAGYHMPADMAFSASVKRSVEAQREVVNGDTAFVLTEAVSRGTFRDQPIHARTMETMVLTRTELGWRISHIHWSSAKIQESHDDGHDHDL